MADIIKKLAKIKRLKEQCEKVLNDPTGSSSAKQRAFKILNDTSTKVKNIFQNLKQR